MPNLTPLVDGDILVYKIGFGCKHGDFLVQVEQIDAFLDWLLGIFGRSPEIYLSNDNKDNFRYSLPAPRPYKGNRHGGKPRYYFGLKEYMTGFLGARVAVGCECDDMIASRSGPDTIIVSTDKDYLQIPGKIFNSTKNEIIEVTEDNAWFNFYVSMLVGDTADNIAGIDGIGKTKAPKLLDNKSKAEMEAVVRGLYDKQYGADSAKMFEVTRDLLWLRRDIKI